ncbi:MAG TPA: NAD(P)/FAD-dependent oxidoreductase [Thermoanaerobaculia bacterium]
MKTNHYDAVIVGARAAGAATAMLLARRGMRVLAVDRASYGSDTLSTHALMRPAVIQLERWGLLSEVIDAGTPPVLRAVFHYPDKSVGLDIEALYAPRRTVLDRILADAAREAGAEVRFGVVVDDLRFDASGRVTGIRGRDDDGHDLTLSAGIVIGADGIRSVVAQQTAAPVTREATAGAACVYGYFRGVEAEGYEWIYGDGVAAGLIPTNDGELCVFAGGSTQRFRRDVQPNLEAGFTRILEEASPAVAERIARGTHAGRFRGFAGVRGYYRKPYGPGWALVGDAGYFRDPIVNHGITDAFRDAELLARAVDGTTSFADYEATRDRVTKDLFAVTERLAAYDWHRDELEGLLRDVSRATRPEMRLLAEWELAAAS